MDKKSKPGKKGPGYLFSFQKSHKFFIKLYGGRQKSD